MIKIEAGGFDGRERERERERERNLPTVYTVHVHDDIYIYTT